MKLNWVKWGHGLLGAIIGGAANSVTVMIVDPATFNLAEGKSKLGAVAIVGAISAAGFYLKTTPVPAWDGEERRSRD